MPIDKLKVAVVQFNPTVGDISGNCDGMFERYLEAAQNPNGCDLVIFPEMATTGYPIEDLATSPLFVQTATKAVDDLLDRVRSSGMSAGILFGCLYRSYHADMIAKNVACLYDPKEWGTAQFVTKYELPNYGVFDEKRVFEGAKTSDLKPLTFRDNTIGVMICEDCWFPTVSSHFKSADLLIAINGSPYEIGKNVTRINVARDRLWENHVSINVPRSRSGEFGGNLVAQQQPFLYVNMVGGQDELVFDGGSFLLSENGLTQCPFFKSGIEYIDVPMGFQNVPEFEMPEPSGIASIYSAVVLGTRDYMRKQGFTSAELGMSGGVDSGIVAVIGTDAVGPENIDLIRLPSKYSSNGSLTDSDRANARLGTNMRTIAIENAVEAIRQAYSTAIHDTAPLEKSATGLRRSMMWTPQALPNRFLTGVSDENVQPRVRAAILMAISNEEGHLLLTTGNKSEVSVGYSTLYGDMAGGFNPIKDCYKTTVWELCRYRNSLTQEQLTELGFLGRVGEMVPEEIIVKPPSAELRPDQQDSDSLPPYEVLDDILRKMIEGQQSVAQISRLDGRDPQIVAKVRGLLDRAEYKRRQAAPGVKITSKLHGRERRVPIINHFSGEERRLVAKEFEAASATG